MTPEERRFRVAYYTWLGWLADRRAGRSATERDDVFADLVDLIPMDVVMLAEDLAVMDWPGVLTRVQKVTFGKEEGHV